MNADETLQAMRRLINEHDGQHGQPGLEFLRCDRDKLIRELAELQTLYRAVSNRNQLLSEDLECQKAETRRLTSELAQYETKSEALVEELEAKDVRIEKLYGDINGKAEELEKLEKLECDRNRWRHDFQEVHAMLRQLATRTGSTMPNAGAAYLVREVYSRVEAIWKALDRVADVKPEGEIDARVHDLADLYGKVCRSLAEHVANPVVATTIMLDDDGKPVSPELIQTLREQTKRLAEDVANKASELFALRMKVKSLEAEQNRNLPYGPTRNPFEPTDDNILRPGTWPAPGTLPPWTCPIGSGEPYPGWPHRIYIGDPLPGQAGTTICDTGMVCGTGGSGGVHPVPKGCAKACNNPDQGCDDLGCSTKPTAITDTPSTGC